MQVASHHLSWAIACLMGVLGIGTCVRFWMLWGRTDEKTQSHFNSIRSWWVMAVLLSIALLLGHLGVLTLLAVAGFLSLGEFIRIVGWDRVGKATVGVVFALTAIYYTSLACGYAEPMRAIAPVAIVLVPGALRAGLGLVEGYIRSTAAMIWGWLLFVYCLSHAYFLLVLPGLPEPWVGNLGWFLYLVLLTETNDIAQALIGREWGRTKITPMASPNKSVEGLAGGIMVTALLAVALAPWLTSLMQPSRAIGIALSALSGVLIATFGFLGDINKSGMKRDAGIKDSGRLIPGQGGMIDRIDSLTFSAPVFYYFIEAVL